jgi:hypothetical protein
LCTKNITNIKSHFYKQHERTNINLGESSMELLDKELIEEHFDEQFISQQPSLKEETYSINAAKRKKKDEDDDDIDDEEDDGLFEEEEEEDENPFDVEPTEEDIIKDEFPDDEDDLFEEEDEDSFR